MVPTADAWAPQSKKMTMSACMVKMQAIVMPYLTRDSVMMCSRSWQYSREPFSNRSTPVRKQMKQRQPSVSPLSTVPTNRCEAVTATSPSHSPLFSKKIPTCSINQNILRKLIFIKYPPIAHKASTFARRFASNFSRLIFQKVSRRITSSSTTQSTTREARTSYQMRSLGMAVMKVRRRSRRLLSISSTAKSSSPRSYSRMGPRRTRTSFAYPYANCMKFRSMTSSGRISSYFFSESRIVARSLSTARRMTYARAKADGCSQVARLMAKDKTSMHFWWFLTRISFLKFYLKGLLAVQVLRSSLLAVVARGLQIRSEPSFFSWFRKDMEASRFCEAEREELALVVSVRVKDRFKLFLGVRSLIAERVKIPFLTSYAKTSAQSARRAGFLVIILLNNFATSGEIWGCGGMTMSSSQMIMMSFPMLLLQKGQYPNNILNRTTPKDQMSDLMEQASPLRISGAMQIGEPSMVLEISSQFSSGLQKPKSANFTIPSCRSKFQGFRSLCMMLCRFNTLNASTT